MMAPPTARAAEQGAALQLDEDEAFDVNVSPEEKWAVVARTIRERGEPDFFNDKCWQLATMEKRKSSTLTALEQWLVKAYDALKHLGELAAQPDREQPDNGTYESDPAAELQDSAPAGHAASWVPQKSLRKTCIDSIPP